MKKLTIRTKLTLWYGVTLLILLGVFIPYLYVSMSNTMYSREESTIRVHLAQAISTVDIGEQKIILPPDKLNAPGTYFYIFDLKNHLISNTVPDSKIAAVDPSYDKPQYIYLNKEKWLVYDQPIYDDTHIIAWIRGIRSLESVSEAMQSLIILSIVAIPIYIIIAIVGGLFISGKALTPIDKITKIARDIGQGNLHQRLNLPVVNDEVGRLANTFDEMLNRLEDAFERERQFTSDASHELRTPIAVITAHAEESFAGEKSLQEFQENMGVVLKESKKMGQMISQLLMLTRSDEGKLKLEIENIDLNIIAHDVILEMQNAAINSGIDLKYTDSESIKIMADQTLIAMMLMNLIDNAIKYNHTGGWVHVSIAKINGSVKLVIEDSGIGIPKDQIPHIFKRFYRVDKARTRNGTGLGLSIAKWIVDAHHGDICVKSDLNQGTTFEISIPIKD